MKGEKSMVLIFVVVVSSQCKKQKTKTKNQNKNQHGASFMARRRLTGVLQLTIHTDLKAPDMLTSGQLLTTLKGASMACFAVSVDCKFFLNHRISVT